MILDILLDNMNKIDLFQMDMMFLYLDTIEGSHVAIKEDCIMIGVPVRRINAFKSLWELNVANFLTTSVHHEAHSFTNSFAVVDVVVTVKVENKWAIGQNG